MKLTVVIGNRPQIIKIAPLVSAASMRKGLELKVVHTGQHYDRELSGLFFHELDLPKPDVNLRVGSGSQATQTGTALMRLEGELVRDRPEAVMVVGDTNSTLSGALAAVKQKIPAVHLEAGARIHDLRTPEEVNRVVADHLSSLLLTPSKTFSQNLHDEGLDPSRIVETGDTMYDAFLQYRGRVDKSKIRDELGLERRAYILLTIHRAENVDDDDNLASIVDAVVKLAPIEVVFPMHPHVAKVLESSNLVARLAKCKHVKLVRPLGYFDILSLVSEALLVLTDSGGLQKESFWLRTPCVTLRERTEWVETVRLGANVLVGSNTSKILKVARGVIKQGNPPKGSPRRVYGDGHASERAVEAVLNRKWRSVDSSSAYSRARWESLMRPK